MPRNNDYPMFVAVKLTNENTSTDFYPSIIEGSAATGEISNNVIAELEPILRFGSDALGTISMNNLENYTSSDSISNGFIVLRESSREGNEYARGDVGGNELTGGFNEYIFDNEQNENYIGRVVLQERVNGYTLVSYQMTGGEDNPSQNSTVGLFNNNHIQYNDGEIMDLKEYEAGSEDIFYTDVRNVSYSDLTTTDNHIRMFVGTEDRGGSYYAVSNIGTAAYTGENELTDIDYFEGVVAIPLEII